MEIIGGYKPCDNYEYCKKYDMLICCDCPHSIKVEEDKENEKN